MKEILDDAIFEDAPSGPSFTDQEIFTKIWTRPRAVLDFIDRTNYVKYFYFILIIYGIGQSFENTHLLGLSGGNQAMMIFKAFILGGALGWISLWIYSALVAVMGRWIEGEARTSRVFHLLTYASIPSFLGLFFVIVQLLLFGNDFLSPDIFGSTSVSEIVFGVIAFIIAIYGIVFSVVAVAIAQKFSYGKAFINLLLPLLVFLILGLIIFLMLDLNNLG